MPHDKKRRLADKLFAGKIAIDMTPMIDIVFQLLTFFIMTLKLATAEGDFQIRMPLAGEPGTPGSAAPIHAFLQADQTGECTRVVLGETELSGVDRWDRLHRQLALIVGEGQPAETTEVQLHCDPGLHYEYAIAAITAISGRVNPADGKIIKLIEKVNFAPPIRTAD